jgi:hypothetical protein
MLICMTTDFARILKKADIGEKKLNEAIREILTGNVISLGRKVFKKTNWVQVRRKTRRVPVNPVLSNRSGNYLYVPLC